MQASARWLPASVGGLQLKRADNPIEKNSKNIENSKVSFRRQNWHRTLLPVETVGIQSISQAILRHPFELAQSAEQLRIKQARA